MRRHNDGAGESSILQNQFTAYLVTAVRRRKIQYIRSKMQMLRHELIQELQSDAALFFDEQDMMQSLPLMDQLEDMRLLRSLERAQERDLYIFLAKALGLRSLAEIASELGVGYTTVTSAYYRMLDRLKNELGGDN